VTGGAFLVTVITFSVSFFFAVPILPNPNNSPWCYLPPPPPSPSPAPPPQENNLTLTIDLVDFYLVDPPLPQVRGRKQQQRKGVDAPCTASMAYLSLRYDRSPKSRCQCWNTGLIRRGSMILQARLLLPLQRPKPPVWRSGFQR
jgi:hypothetical protein